MCIDDDTNAESKDEGLGKARDEGGNDFVEGSVRVLAEMTVSGNFVKERLLGSSDAIQVDVAPGESCSGDNATTCNIVVKIGSETFQFNESGGDATSQRSSEGPIIVSAEGVGDYTISVSVQRQLPLEALPVIFGLFLVIWGEWRKRQ